MRRFGKLMVLAATLAIAGAQAAPPPRLTVFAAASLKESLDDVAARWRARSGQEVVVVYAGSSTLARQIDQGAPAQVFVSADRQWMDWLQQRRRVDAGSRSDLLGNRLVLVAGARNAMPAMSVESALPAMLGPDRGRLAVADVDSVPAGKYAKQALQSLGRWDPVASRLAMAEDVRAALAFVARGEAPLGIVYATDAKAEPAVRVVATFPVASHDPVVYPVARVAGTPPDVAEGFLRFLRSSEAACVFVAAGFTVQGLPAGPADAAACGPDAAR